MYGDVDDARVRDVSPLRARTYVYEEYLFRMLPRNATSRGSGHLTRIYQW